MPQAAQVSGRAQHLMSLLASACHGPGSGCWPEGRPDCEMDLTAEPQSTLMLHTRGLGAKTDKAEGFPRGASGLGNKKPEAKSRA